MFAFFVDETNIGGSGIDGDASSSKQVSYCEPKSSAGATYLPHALKHMAAHFQPMCSKNNNNTTWSSVYIAKLDIEGSEFSALSSAMDWLIKYHLISRER